MKRDPRTSPAVGDVLLKNGTYRVVNHIHHGCLGESCDRTHIDVVDRPMVVAKSIGVERSPSLSQFRRWAKLAQVVR